MKKAIVSLVIILIISLLFVGCTKHANLRKRLTAEGYTERAIGGDSVSEDGTWTIKRSNKSIADYNSIEVIKCKTYNAAKELAAYRQYKLEKNSRYVVVRKGKIVYIGKRELIDKILG